jgi:small subunit ribosomal protein S24e
LELKIVEERKNPLLKRTEYRFEIGHVAAATPKRDEVRQALATALKVPKDRVIVERMHAKFGTPLSVGEAATYASKDAALATVREHILIRNGLKAKPSATPTAGGEAAPAEPAKPEAAAPEPAKAEKAEPAEKPAKAEKPEPAEKPAEKPAKAEKHEKTEKPAKAEKSDKPAKKDG